MFWWEGSRICDVLLGTHHVISRNHPSLWHMRIFALVVLSILAGVILLVGSSYIDIYVRLFEASFSLRPVTTISVVLAVALLLWFAPRHFRPGS